MPARKKVQRPKLGGALAESIFLDVVGYSRRTIESQTFVIETLNRIVRRAVLAHRLGPNRVLFIPTGDGMCVALLNIGHPYDIQMQVALAILKGLHEHNSQTAEEQRRFEVRIGINANRDNVVLDVNRRRNLSGAGINEAARIMDKADGGQILVGHSVFETLKARDKYISSFSPYTAIVKWGLALRVYQFVGRGFPFLNVDVPGAFETQADVAAQKGPRSPEVRQALRQRGLKIRVEIGPSSAEVRRAKFAHRELKRPYTVTALIDTGASRTVISPQLATTCGLQQTGRVRISSVGRITDQPEFSGAIHFPDQALRGFDPVTLVACPLPTPDVACILGRDVLAKWRLTYNGRTGEVQIEE
jgi:class 3 adenylate cyclase/predicted aspartyl protease